MHGDAIEAEELNIYLTESASYSGKALFEWLIVEAMRMEMAGATAVKGLVGFGRHHKLHHGHLLSLSDDLPVTVEVVDTAQKIDAFLDHVRPALAGYTYTRQAVRLHRPETGTKSS